MTIFNPLQIDYTEEPMFFGKELNSQRYDRPRFPVFNKLTDRQLSYFWRPDEIGMQEDVTDFPTLSKENRFVFTENLSYQILLDSVQSRGIGEALLPIVSQPEIESAIIAWEFMEMIHSKSYSHMIQNVYSQPSKVFDEILTNEAIMARLGSVTDNYDKLMKHNENIERDENGRVILTRDHMRQLYLTLIDIHILEGIRFQVSFAVTFAFGQNKMMKGSAEIIQLIARDEALHMAITHHLINNLPNESQEWADVINEARDEALGMFMNAIEEEKIWAKYLGKPDLPGVNDDLLIQYMNWIGDKRLRALGFEPQFGQNENPIPWVESWTNSRKMQTAGQETEPTSYVVSSINKEVGSDVFDEL